MYYLAEVTIWGQDWGMDKLRKHTTPAQSNEGALNFAKRYISQYGGYAEVRCLQTGWLLWVVEETERQQIAVHSVCAAQGM